MKLKSLPPKPYVCILDGQRFVSLGDLDYHLKEDHNTTLSEMKNMAPSTTGPQGPEQRKR
jgi:hypothetical protein